MNHPDLRDGRRGIGDVAQHLAEIVSGEEFAAPEEAHFFIRNGSNPLATDRLKLADLHGFEVVFLPILGDGTGDRVVRVALEGVGGLENELLGAWGKALGSRNFQLARGQRAGLVESDTIDFGQFFNRRTSPKKHSHAGSASDAGQNS